MPQAIREVMTPQPVALSATAPVIEAARQMRQLDIGDVIVEERGNLCGVVTDRDIVVRVLAEDRDPNATKLGDVCSRNLVTVRPDDTVDRAVQMMREHALRRLPVSEGGRLVGIVSIGDLAIEHDERSALADISSAAPNN